jgi:hypothetical protein
MRFHARLIAILLLVILGLSIGVGAEDINLEFDGEPVIGIWCYTPSYDGVYATFGCGDTPYLGLIPNYSHASIYIETQVVGNGVGVIFGYLDPQNYFAFYMEETGPETADYVLIQVSDEYEGPRQLARVSNPMSGLDIPGSYMKVVVVDGNIECFFNELPIISVATENMPTLAGVGIHRWSDLRISDLNMVFFLRISDSDSDPHPCDDGLLVLPRMELRNGLFQSEEKADEVEHVISVFIWNLGNAPMHNVRWRATVAECANSNWFWDEDQRNIGTLEPRASRYIRFELLSPLNVPVCLVFEASYDGQSGEPSVLAWRYLE